MSAVADIPKTYEAAIETLTRWQIEDEMPSQDLEIYCFPDALKTAVRLLSVSDDFPATGDALPVTFGRSADFPFVSSLAIATKDEWRDILNGKLKLPLEWKLSEKRKV